MAGRILMTSLLAFGACARPVDTAEPSYDNSQTSVRTVTVTKSVSSTSEADAVSIRTVTVTALVAGHAPHTPIISNESTESPTTSQGTNVSSADRANTTKGSETTRSPSTTGITTSFETPTTTTKLLITRERPEWVEDYEAQFGRGVLRDHWKTMTPRPWAPILSDPKYHDVRINEGFHDGPMTDYTHWTVTATETGKPTPLNWDQLLFMWPPKRWGDPEPFPKYEVIYGEANYPGRIQPHESDYVTEMNDPLGWRQNGIRSTMKEDVSEATVTVVVTVEPTGDDGSGLPTRPVMEVMEPRDTMAPTIQDMLNNRVVIPGGLKETDLNETVAE